MLPTSMDSNFVAMAATTAAITGTVAAFTLVFKPAYVKYIRKDVSTDPKLKPVLGRLRRPVHGSHRGGSRKWPENTMLAFRNAVHWTDGNGDTLSTQVLEFDIQLTRDGHLIIMHNEVVDDTTDGHGQVANHSLEEIRSLDAGYKFTQDGGLTFPYRGQDLRVPTLTEVLREFVPIQHLVFYLDFKHPQAVGPTLELVREFGIEERVICGAVPPAANKELLRLKPACIPATPDLHSMIFMYVCYVLGLLWAVPMRHEIVGTTAYRWGTRVLTEEMVRAFHERGRWMAVFGDYIDSKEGQLDCIWLGCDVLVTDRPDVLHAALDEWRQQGATTLGQLSK